MLTGPSPSTPAGPWASAPTPPPLPRLDPETGLPTGAHHRDLAYHRLALSDPKHRRWSPLAEGGSLLVGIFAITIVFFIGVVIFIALGGLDSLLTDLGTGDVNEMDLTNPWMFVMMFGSIAIWLPVIVLCRWLFRPRPVGLIWSVTGKIRWKWLLLTFGVATGVFVVIYGAVTLLEAFVLAPESQEPVAMGSRHSLWVLTLVLMLIVVPLQCTAEELVFRGYMAQALGRWLKNPAWVILLPAPLFMLGHMYDLWGQLSVLWMAVVTGFLTWKTGGLEAAISLHVVNNLIVTITSVIWPVDPAQAEDTSVGWLGFGVIFAIETIYALIVLLLIKRSGIAVTRRAVVWPKKDQDAWYDKVRAAYAGAGFHRGHYGPAGHGPAGHGPAGYGYPAPIHSAPMGAGIPGHPAAPAPQPVSLVPVNLPASMAYVDPAKVNDDGSLRLVPADGLIAYAAPELEMIPGSDPPVYAHPVVWMAKTTPNDHAPTLQDNNQ